MPVASWWYLASEVPARWDQSRTVGAAVLSWSCPHGSMSRDPQESTKVVQDELQGIPVFCALMKATLLVSGLRRMKPHSLCIGLCVSGWKELNLDGSQGGEARQCATVPWLPLHTAGPQPFGCLTRFHGLPRQSQELMLNNLGQSLSLQPISWPLLALSPVQQHWTPILLFVTLGLGHQST